MLLKYLLTELSFSRETSAVLEHSYADRPRRQKHRKMKAEIVAGSTNQCNCGDLQAGISSRVATQWTEFANRVQLAAVLAGHVCRASASTLNSSLNVA